MLPNLILKPGREKSLLRRHPWIFSGAIDRIEGSPKSGETVSAVSSNGRFLGLGAYSPVSQIRARIWSFGDSNEVDKAFFERRIKDAKALREKLVDSKEVDSFRLVASESDGLPGIIIDRYGEQLVVQLLSTGAERNRGEILAALESVYPNAPVYERSDSDIRTKEGLEPKKGPLKGAAPTAPLQISENGMKFLVDVVDGQKTGFYLDQRQNRAAARAYCGGARVLNCFAYTGGFGVAAMKGGAKEVINIDTSDAALGMAKDNFSLNGFGEANAEFQRADVFQLLRTYRDGKEKFDVVILDPPKFADSKAKLTGACRGYKDINLLAMNVLKPGGTLLTFSCSGLVPPDLFQKMVADAAVDAGRDAQIVSFFRQASDHPVSIHFPEGLYLKGLALRVL